MNVRVVTSGCDPETLAVLSQRYPRLRLWEAKNLFFGGVHAARWHEKRGANGAGDPRRQGVARIV